MTFLCVIAGGPSQQRSAGAKPWAKPDFYHRSTSKPTPVFTSKAPGPGEVLSVHSVPGSHTGSVVVRAHTHSLCVTVWRSLCVDVRVRVCVCSFPQVGVQVPVVPVPSHGSLSTLSETLASMVIDGPSATLARAKSSDGIHMLRVATPGPGAYNQRVCVCVCVYDCVCDCLCVC